MAGRIFVTGDCHGELMKFNTKNFPIQKELDEDDYVIVCGDFGVIWDQVISKRESHDLEWLNQKKYKTLFVCGNHENFDRLYAYPVEEWNGGLVHKISEKVYYLMRGQVFNLAGKKIFTFGGAESHDTSGGVLEITDKNKMKELDKEWIPYRVNHYSWWKEELASEEEMVTGIENLKKNGNKVDYIITHCAASSTQIEMWCDRLFKSLYKSNSQTDYLDYIKSNVEFKEWYFGHYHKDQNVNEKERVIYNNIIELV